MAEATISVGTNRPTNVFGNFKLRSLANKGIGMLTNTLTFDGGTYARGGISIDLSSKLLTVDYLNIESTRDYKFLYDRSTGKVKAYKPMPPLIVEESVTVASNTGTLANVPLYICAIQVTAGTTTGAFNVIPTGETPLTKQCAVTFTTGVLTFLSTDAVTTAKVTYIPAAESGPLAQANSLVTDESVTAAAAKSALANRAIAVQYVWNDTNNKIVALEPVGEAPSATETAVIDIDDSGDTKIDSHADDEGDTLKVTYLKYSAFPAALHIGDGDTSLTSEAYDFTKTGGYHCPVVGGLGTNIVGEEADTTNAVATIQGPSATAANVVAEWHPMKNYWLTNNTAAMVTFAMPFLILDTTQLGTCFYEVPAGEVISAAPTFLAFGTMK